MSSLLQPSGHSRARKWHLKPKCRKGTQQHRCRFLHLQPLLHALGEKPSHWSHLHPHRTKCLPEMERGSQRCQQPSGL